LAEPGDVADLAAKVFSLLSRPNIARAMGAAGRRAVRKYSLSRHVEKTIEIYEKAITAKAAVKAMYNHPRNTENRAYLLYNG